MVVANFEIENDNKKCIHICVSNPIYSCSTLILSCFPHKYGSTEYPVDPVNGKPEDSPFGGGTLEKFLDDLVKGIDAFWTNQMPYNPLHVCKYAFVVASVQKEQGLVSQYLDELGFTGTPWVFNQKNKTDVRYFILPMPDFVQTLKDRGLEFMGDDKIPSKYSKELNDF